MKENLHDKYLSDFEKMRGALLSQIANNSKLDEDLMTQFAQEDFTNLEEHAVLSKIILDSTKALSDAYKLVPDIVEKIGKSEKQENKINLDDLLDE